MRILFITNIPSPYRVDFFNELGKRAELTVCYERAFASDRDANWIGADLRNYNEIYANVKPLGADKSFGYGIVSVIKKNKFDRLIIAGYASPSVMLAIAYCRIKRIPYYIESDGGFFHKDGLFKRKLKQFLLRGAIAQFTTCDEHKKYLLSIGVKENRIFKYRFSSIKDADILQRTLSNEEKSKIRNKLKIQEHKVILSVGQFIHRKGYDVLLEALKDVPSDVGVYIIGGTATEEYVSKQKEYKLNNVHFMEFMSKNDLEEWYLASDFFVFPTREDIWGLVINEAMSKGLPIITTNKCIAGLELVKKGSNGYIVESENAYELSKMINTILSSDDLKRMSMKSLETASNYTIEKMTDDHMFVLKEKAQ